MLMRLARRMAILPPRKFQRPPTSLPQNLEAQLAMSVMSGELDSEASSAMLDRRSARHSHCACRVGFGVSLLGNNLRRVCYAALDRTT